MIKGKDTTLAVLVQKKKSLLDNLLVLSIKSACDLSNPDRAMRQRSDILAMLEKNDEAIKTREQQTGIEATGQEKALFADISALLTSIKDNNQTTLLKLETMGKEYEIERLKLAQEKKLSKYVIQTKTMNHYRQKNRTESNKFSLVKGTL